MPAMDFCPELPHAPGHIIAVEVQIRKGGKGSWRRPIRGETLEIHLHGLRQCQNQLPDQLLIRRRELEIRLKTFLKPFQKRSLSLMGLKRDKTLLDLRNHRKRGRGAELILKQCKIGQTRRCGEKIRVGNGISSPAEKIGERDLLTGF